MISNAMKRKKKYIRMRQFPTKHIEHNLLSQGDNTPLNYNEPLECMTSARLSLSHYRGCVLPDIIIRPAKTSSQQNCLCLAEYDMASESAHKHSRKNTRLYVAATWDGMSISGTWNMTVSLRNGSGHSAPGQGAGHSSRDANTASSTAGP